MILLLLILIVNIVNADTLYVPVSTVSTLNYEPSYSVKAYILYEINTDTVVIESNSDDRLAPASITKIMSLILIYDAIKADTIDLEDIVTISEHAAGMGGSQIYLEPYEKMTVRDLLKSIIIASANDACTAMAEYISGSESAFVQAMNEKAALLGMNNTNFVNCCGLDEDGHYSSAGDIAIMSDYLLTNYPEIKEYTLTWMDSIIHKTDKGESEFGLTNTNKMIRYYEGITGLKTGSTANSGYSLSASANRDDTYYVAVVLGASSTKERFLLAGELLDYGFGNTKVIKIDSEEIMQSLTFDITEEGRCDFYAKEDIYLFCERKIDKNQLEIEFIYDEVCSDIGKDAEFGYVRITFEGTELATAEMYSCEKITIKGFGFFFRSMLKSVVC